MKSVKLIINLIVYLSFNEEDVSLKEYNHSKWYFFKDTLFGLILQRLTLEIFKLANRFLVDAFLEING